MRRLLLLFILLSPVTLSASVSCGTSRYEDWDVVVSSDAPRASVAVGETIDVVVHEEVVGPLECSSSSSSSSSGSGSGGCSGGASSCSRPRESLRAEILSLACQGACDAEPGGRRENGDLVLRVTGHAAGAASVLVKLRDERNGVVTKVIDVAFAPATEVAVTRGFFEAPYGSTYGMLQGTSFTWCASLDGARGPLVHDPENLVVAVAGPITAPSPVPTKREHTRCDSFTAQAPGTAEISYTYRGLLRREQVRIVNPADVVGMELVSASDLVLPGPITDDVTPVEVDPLRSRVPITTYAGRYCYGTGADDEHAAATFAVRLATRSGDLALGAGDRLSVQPGGSARIMSREEHWTLGAPPNHALAVLVSRGRAEGNIVGSFGGARLEVPFVISDECTTFPSDAGADAGTDADARD